MVDIILNLGEGQMKFIGFILIGGIVILGAMPKRSR